MGHILTWMYVKRDLLEIWLLNGTLATLTFTDLPVIIVSISGLVTIGYTLWKWRKEAKEKKN